MNDSDKKIQEKMNAVTSVPGSSFDKDAAWQKLQMRMDKKPVASRKRRYYPMAAVVIAVLIGIALLMPQRKAEVAPSTPMAALPANDTHVSADTVPAIPVAASQKPAHRIKHNTAHVTSAPANINVSTVVQSAPATQQPVITEPVIARTSTPPKPVKVIHVSDVAEEVPVYRPTPRNGFITIAQYRYKNTVSQPTVQNNAQSVLFK